MKNATFVMKNQELNLATPYNEAMIQRLFNEMNGQRSALIATYDKHKAAYRAETGKEPRQIMTDAPADPEIDKYAYPVGSVFKPCPHSCVPMLPNQYNLTLNPPYRGMVFLIDRADPLAEGLGMCFFNPQQDWREPASALDNAKPEYVIWRVYWDREGKVASLKQALKRALGPLMVA